MPLPHGIADELITEALAARLTDELVHVRSQLDPAEADRRIAQHVAETVARVVRALPADNRAESAAELANRIVELLATEVERADLTEGDHLRLPPQVRLASYEPTLGATEPTRPETPLRDTILFTNSPTEPNLASEIGKEMASADRVDALIAFVKWSGLRLIADRITDRLKAGKPLRVITTTYTGVTERRALDWLVEQGADVKVAYDARATRLHAKAWLFERDTGFDTAWIGSSNLSKSALVDGLEWNVRASRVTSPDIVDKFTATFESYWSDDHFEPYNPAEDADRFDLAVGAARATTTPIDLSFVDVQPYAFQRQMLDDLAVERHRHGRWRNLVVAATGTGKTVVAALDYRRLRKELERSRLLFIAHRKEILQQSLTTFRAVLRDQTFGELYVDGTRPEQWEHVFASVQGLSAYDATRIPADHFDVVIVDEFHHAAANTYRALLEHLDPKVLVGLTATPERADGQSVLEWFDDRIAVELRLWEAIDSGHLVPFHYFGVHDGIDLSHLEWRAGGYQVSDLDNVYTGDDARVGIVLEAMKDKVDPQHIKALGFCVSIAHAEYMAKKFNQAGIPSVAVSANTGSEERADALRQLRNGNLSVVFAVDLFNEGVDVPDVDTVLFLRPTESLTLFLQQLGRGLRRADDKAVLTVLDFVGNQHRKFRFDQRFRALTGDTRQGVIRQIENGFPYLPSGCHIELDGVARQVVLNHIKSSLPVRWPDRVAELRQMGDVGLGEYLEETGLDLTDVYSGGKSWTSHRRAAGQLPVQPGGFEEQLGRSLGRMLHIDDELRIGTYRDLLSRPEPPAVHQMSRLEHRVAFMLSSSLWDREKLSVEESIDRLWIETPIRQELVELLGILDEQASHLPLTLKDDLPLRVHARYSLAEIMAGMGISTPDRQERPQAGVRWDEDTQTDLFFVTLEKSERDFSPTTRYRDYAMSPNLFHWESQSTTRADSDTGQRYINHEQLGTRVFIFARERKQDDGRTMPYLFLGPASYVRHQRERPMEIVWRLQYEMPADFYHEAAVAAG
jgi:superfamily II DNA or RNA helicase/HKD family nuclease